MKLLILSTDTKHHTYFINKVAEQFEICGIVYERRRLKKSYPVGPFFVKETDRFEKKFFDPDCEGTSPLLPSQLKRKMIEVHTINDTAVAAYLKAIQPDLGICFGTGRIRPFIFNIPAWGTINLHRGFIQNHRGLDTDLWAIHRQEFDQLGITLHYMEEELDAGDILAQQPFRVEAADLIFSLQYKATVLAAQMTLSLLKRFEKEQKRISGQPVKKLGKYFTAMPLEKKWEAYQKFQAYQETRNDA